MSVFGTASDFALSTEVGVNALRTEAEKLSSILATFITVIGNLKFGRHPKLSSVPVNLHIKFSIQ